jgi:hypothetical protein
MITNGSWIQIISEANSLAAKPDYDLVLPWAFFGAFYAREPECRVQGGWFIVSLPDFRMVL